MQTVSPSFYIFYNLVEMRHILSPFAVKLTFKLISDVGSEKLETKLIKLKASLRYFFKQNDRALKTMKKAFHFI